MQDFSSFWVNYLEFCQRAWLDMARLYTPGLPAQTSREQTGGTSPLAQLPQTPSVDAWLALFAPWTPKVETEIQSLQPFVNTAAGLAEATRVSLRVFMPWGGESWLDALATGQKTTPTATSAAKQENRLSNAERAERAVIDAIKRSKTQD